MTTNRDIFIKGHLTARPDSKIKTGESAPGVQALGLAGERDGYIYVPKDYDKSRPVPLAVMLHGAGGDAQHGISLLLKYADEKSIILIAPASRDSSWDIITKRAFDKDVIYIDQAMEMAFENFAIDPERIAIGGFSDGASYALSIGLSNGNLFTHIIAFSPGFAHTLERVGNPAVFISHGIKDRVLPVGPCSRRIVPQLQEQGYQVNYLEFDGAHEIPLNISKSGVEWFTKRDE